MRQALLARCRYGRVFGADRFARWNASGNLCIRCVDPLGRGADGNRGSIDGLLALTQVAQEIRYYVDLFGGAQT